MDLLGIDLYGKMHKVWVRVRGQALTVVPTVQRNGGISAIEWMTISGETIQGINIDTWAYPFPLGCEFACLLLPSTGDWMSNTCPAFTLVLRATRSKPEHFVRVGIWSIAAPEWQSVYKDRFADQRVRSLTLL